MNTLALSALPAPPVLLVPAESLETDGKNSLRLAAPAQTDWFFDPGGAVYKHDAPVALFLPPAQDFVLRARVTVEFRSTFDAGVLFVYGDETHWAKLCFEYSPQGQPMVVSVVTREVSDDCNSVTISGNRVYLRMHRQGRAWAFHFSPDGAFWHFVRYFNLGVQENVRVGFSAQAPTGQGCRVEFGEIEYQARTLADLRSGE